jgi:hypothetical protein
MRARSAAPHRPCLPWFLAAGPIIEVITSIQPLTKTEAEKVLGTTTSEYFKTTIKQTLNATQLALVDGSELTAKIGEPATAYQGPKPGACAPPPPPGVLLSAPQYCVVRCVAARASA